MGKVIAFASQKGGSGKSTIATGLAGLVHRTSELAVCVIDADPQRTASTWASKATKRPEFAGLQLLEHTQPDLDKRGELAGKGRLVIIDCPGRLDEVLQSAIYAADLVVVPVQATYADLWALPLLAEQCAIAQQRRKKPLQIAVLLNRIRNGTTLAKRADELGASLPAGFQMLATRMRDLADFQLAMGDGCTPCELHAKGNAAADLQALHAELKKLVRF